MSGSRMTISGVDALRKRLLSARERLPDVVLLATAEAIDFVQTQAQRILDEEIYDKSRPEFAAPLSKESAGSLWSSFLQEVGEVGAQAHGKLTNTSPHAIFLEFGTDDEGTGEHFVPVDEAGALSWINPLTGQRCFSKGHMVHGIHPIRFMSRALHEHKADIVAIFRKHLNGLFDQ